MRFVRIFNHTNQLTEPILARYCQSFFCQLRGLMFTRTIPQNQGLLLVQDTDGKLNASIHMMFMFMDLAVIWINSDFLVVDKVLARRWKLSYFPKHAAKYVLETSVSHISEFNIGDTVRFEAMG